MRTKLVGAVALVLAGMLAVGALVSPGGEKQAAEYCAALRAHLDTLRGYTGPGDTATLDTAIDQANHLTDLAPSDLRNDWQLLTDYLGRVRDAGRDQAKLQALADDPAGQQVAEANTAITTQGSTACGLTTA